MNSSNDSGSNKPSPGSAAAEVWQNTRAQTALATQFLEDEDAYLAPGTRDIGRETSVNERELFVSCAPADAMQQQFEHLQPQFIALHDIATASSRKLLTGIAAASGKAVQRLVIRRQSHGTPLATLEFVELPTPDGSSLRMYSTAADADTAARHGLARMLLAFSRLGVIMVGDLPGHSIASALKPFHEAMLAGPWPNRQLLLLPLASGSALVAQGVEMARGTVVTVRTTPQVTRPAEAWEFIDGTWRRLREQAPPGESAPQAAAGSAAAVAPNNSVPADELLTLRPMPIVTAAARADRGGAQRSVLERYVHQLSELHGMVSCCVFDVASGIDVAHAGASPGAADLATHGKAMLAGISAACRTLGLGHAPPEAAITLGAHHLLLRAVPAHPALALHAVLDKATANLTLARLQVQRLDALFEVPART